MKNLALIQGICFVCNFPDTNFVNSSNFQETSSTSEKSEWKFEEFREMDLDFLSNESYFSSFLRIGLFLGAIFQIVCIGFVIFDNDQDDEKVGNQRHLCTKVIKFSYFRIPKATLTLHRSTGEEGTKMTKRREDSLIYVNFLRF